MLMRRIMSTKWQQLLLASCAALLPSQVAFSAGEVLARGNYEITVQDLKQIVGSVVDGATGEPVIGATVQVEGKSVGAITDLDGTFKINAATGDYLAISYIGYETKRVKIGSQKILVVELLEDATKLDLF